MRFAMRFIFDSVCASLTRDGTAGEMTARDESGKRAENSVRDASGSLLGRSGMVRMWVKRSTRHVVYDWDGDGNVVSGKVVSDTRSGNAVDDDLASIGYRIDLSILLFII
jgi:hypothetical protein